MNKHTQLYTFLIIPVLLLLIVPYFLLSYAQSTSVSATGCFIINQNDLPSNYPLPPGCDTTLTGGFTNPFPGGWVPNRLDMGYDGTFKGNIVAPFSGTVTFAGLYHGWVGGNGVTSYGVQLEAATNVGLPTVAGVPSTKSLYFTEGVYPLVTSGQKVSAGTPIAKAYPSPYGDAYATNPSGSGEIEWGVSQDVSGLHQADTYSIEIGNCTSKSRTMVLSFSQWAQQKLHVSAPSQTSQAGCP